MKAQTLRRLSKRFSLVAGAVALAIILLLAFFVVLRPKSSALRRVNVVLATSPVTVWSWDRQDDSFTGLSIPSDTVIESVHGYGKYSLEAIWKLGFIDKKQGSILAESLTDTLGIPTPWFIGQKKEGLPSTASPIAYAKERFSLAHLPAFILGGYQSNMPASLFFSFSRALAAARSDKISLIDLSQKSATVGEPIPDGTTQSVLDPTRVDAIVKGLFEDELLRREGVSVAIYNTTQIPALGNHAARVLTTIGVLVLTVGNDEPEVSRCQLVGDQKTLHSQTAAVIAELFDCQLIQGSEQQHTDLTMRIGSVFARQFESPKAQTH